MDKKFILLLFFHLSFFISFAQLGNNYHGDSIRVTKIYDTEEYSAFTDLLRFNNAFYCAFRVGVKHVGHQDFGKVRIIKSYNGVNWQSTALLETENVDLRDPKLSITPDGKIMVIMAGALWGTDNSIKNLYPMVSFSNKSGHNFKNPRQVILDSDIQSNKNWIWRVTWSGNVGYGIDYQIREDNMEDRSKLAKDAWLLYLLKTKDGNSFEKVSKLEVDHLPNESTIRFDRDKNMYVLIRRESGNKMGVLAKSCYPYTDWQYTNLDFRLGGPNFLFLNDSNLVIGTRKYGEKRSTNILVTNLDGNVLKEIELPSGGDTSYPGMVIYDQKLWISYYSSHEGNPNIYLAQLPLIKLY